MKELTELLDKVAAYSPKTDLGLVEHAFQLAQKAHQSYKRLSGDPYITHPLAVALILAELEQDVFAIAAALLHDVVEDAGITPTG